MKSDNNQLNKTAILIIILLSYVLIVLDVSIVLTALPDIHKDIGFSNAGLAWVQSAYTLTFGGFMLLGARAGDIFGRRRILIIGLAVFTSASMLVGTAQTPTWIITARAIQGLGAAILAPSTLALLQTTFTGKKERNNAISFYSAMAGISASVGLVLGGIFADLLSWRIGFFINVPLGAGMIFSAIKYIPESETTSEKVDIAGAITSTLGMVLIVYSLISSAKYGWGDTETLLTFLISILLILFFVRIESKANNPIMPLSLFADSERASAYAARVLFLGAMIGFYFFTPLFLQNVLGYRPAVTGAAFLPATIVNFISAMSFPKLSGKFGKPAVLLTGFISTGIGLFWLSHVTLMGSYFADIALPMVCIGLGQGLVLSPLTSSGMARVSAQQAGAASGIVNVAHQTGNSLGLAVLVALSTRDYPGLTETQNLAHHVSLAMKGACGMAILGFILTLVFIVPAIRKTESTR